MFFHRLKNKKSPLLIIISLLFLTACQQNEKDDEIVTENNGFKTKEELIIDIQNIQPHLAEEELQEKKIEELKHLLQELLKNKQKKEEQLLQEIDPNQKGPDQPYLHHDPNPDRFPTYEKPRPVPNPPFEDK